MTSCYQHYLLPVDGQLLVSLHLECTEHATAPEVTEIQVHFELLVEVIDYRHRCCELTAIPEATGSA